MLSVPKPYGDVDVDEDDARAGDDRKLLVLCFFRGPDSNMDEAKAAGGVVLRAGSEGLLHTPRVLGLTGGGVVPESPLPEETLLEEESSTIVLLPGDV